MPPPEEMDIEITIVTDVSHDDPAIERIAHTVVDEPGCPRRVERTFDVEGDVLTERIEYYHDDEQIHHTEQEWMLDDDGHVCDSGETIEEFAASSTRVDPQFDLELVDEYR